MIQVQNLSVGYGRRRVLSDVSLSVKPGRMTGLLGPNGSGKTTLMGAMGGVLPVRSGSVQLLDEDGTTRDFLSMDARQRAQVLSFIPQKVQTSFPLRCSTIVMMGRYPHLSSFANYSEDDIIGARQAMERAGIAHLWDRSVDAISGGELQRVLFARALAQKTNIMFLDEPSASLDMAGTVNMFDMLREIADDGGLVFVTVHDLNLAALYCDELIFLKHGEIVGNGRTEDVFTEERLSEIYETPIRVQPHALGKVPQAQAVPRAFRNDALFSGASKLTKRCAG
ncbi:ABC transporter ATP-binding protein [Desulfobaculum bizertense]|uniref:Iron complex transport system ATP-binding protein n=1 Tax=Desulfobaculum bizertense DSM 18034 TaxID=1121442 RepID=A0A1T4W2B1_9BACT|nr:ABC transporter ATP-binding protein [Desulfobaculum bizertense]UIJ38857.1 ABC transporter ATP-binding protein [Desulfobaculum bizertense]SKA71383.1 iron complex transport system ATP-binding protein [Desulfobaculum bizertense DSM 18034]